MALRNLRRHRIVHERVRVEGDLHRQALLRAARIADVEALGVLEVRVVIHHRQLAVDAREQRQPDVAGEVVEVHAAQVRRQQAAHLECRRHRRLAEVLNLRRV